MSPIGPALALVAALAAGEKAPDFSLPSTAGGDVRLSDFRGKGPVLVAFFPAVFTPGCTTQLTGYRDDLARFTAAGVTILAVSTDPTPSQKAFAEAHGLPFALLSDRDHRAMKAFGVPALQEHYATRSVFLIDAAGTVTYADPEYRVGKSEPALERAIAQLGPAKQGAAKQGHAKQGAAAPGRDQ